MLLTFIIMYTYVHTVDRHSCMLTVCTLSQHNRNIILLRIYHKQQIKIPSHSHPLTSVLPMQVMEPSGLSTAGRGSYKSVLQSSLHITQENSPLSNESLNWSRLVALITSGESYV